MKRQIEKMQTIVSLLLVIFILLAAIPLTTRSQQKPIIISFGQPNIWSLDQAHYLLARMHRQNLDLQTAELGDINPNEVNARRINIVKSLLQAGFKYDEAVRINNQLRKNDKTVDSQRRPELLAQRSALQSESIQLSREIAALKLEKSKTEDAEEKAALDEQIEAKTEEKAAVTEQLTHVSDELKNLSTVSGDFQSVTGETAAYDDSKLPSSALDTLIKENVKDFTKEPTIAASQRLENHVQMQYEIIAKQLTLLRDEVGPGERIVFLELPQSINTSQDKAENKMAQVWWRIGGYTKLNKNELLKKEIENLTTQITTLQNNLIGKRRSQQTFTNDNAQLISQIENLQTRSAPLNIDLFKLREQKLLLDREKLALSKTLEALEKGEKPPESLKEIQDVKLQIKVTGNAIDRTESSIGRTESSIAEINRAIKDTEEAIQSNDKLSVKSQTEIAGLSQSLSALFSKYENLKTQEDKNKIKDIQNTADRLLQGGKQNNDVIVNETLNLLGTQNTKYYSPAYLDVAKNGEPRSFVSLEIPQSDESKISLKRQTVRTVDIIPRQNALNVNDTKETVKATGIVAAFSFLFGFGGNVSYQRKRETYEQSLNQELYTSGFGKGNTDFGWNFYPFAGTKQIAPGVRTTYAVAIIPEDAETIMLKAKGCYFPRKQYQPLDYDSASGWKNKNEKKAGCSSQEQMFIIPVPGGSEDGADFYVTGMWYAGNRKTSERMTASIYGRNFSPQMGVLVNGVALTPSIGLAQPGVESILSDKVGENCFKDICGRFERIDSSQIVMSFNVPKEFKKTPKIMLVAPGKAIEINRLNLSINGNENVKLDDSAYMFGSPETKPAIAITDFKIASPTKGILTGEGFEKVKTFYINGIANASDCKSENDKKKTLCVFDFSAGTDDVISVTLSPINENDPVISETFPNPYSLKINNAAIVALEAADKENPSVLTVKLEGAGFHEGLNVGLDATSLKRGTQIRSVITPTFGQMVLEITSSGPVVQITLSDPNTNGSVTTILRVPSPESVSDDPKERSKN